jgi:hypothetical protein
MRGDFRNLSRDFQSLSVCCSSREFQRMHERDRDTRHERHERHEKE